MHVCKCYMFYHKMPFLELINLVVFFKWEHVGFKIDIFSGIFKMSICEL